MTTAIERLEEILDAKDGELRALQRKLEAAEDRVNYDARWCMHVEHEEGSEPNPELPVPRLEIRWSEIKGETTAVYSLVYRHLCGQVVFVPLGQTRTSGALNRQVRSDGIICTPYRDGAHYANEMRQLGLRGFVICGGVVHETKMCPKCGRLDEVHRSDDGFGDSCTLP